MRKAGLSWIEELFRPFTIHYSSLSISAPFPIPLFNHYPDRVNTPIRAPTRTDQARSETRSATKTPDARSR